jgi:hypothetical protein
MSTTENHQRQNEFWLIFSMDFFLVTVEAELIIQALVIGCGQHFFELCQFISPARIGLNAVT